MREPFLRKSSILLSNLANSLRILFLFYWQTLLRWIILCDRCLVNSFLPVQTSHNQNKSLPCTPSSSTTFKFYAPRTSISVFSCYPLNSINALCRSRTAHNLQNYQEAGACGSADTQVYFTRSKCEGSYYMPTCCKRDTSQASSHSGNRYSTAGKTSPAHYYHPTLYNDYAFKLYSTYITQKKLQTNQGLQCIEQICLYYYISHVMYTLLRVLLLGLVLIAVTPYEKIESIAELSAYYHQHFQYPIVQLLHNENFLKSNHFDDIESVFREAEYKLKDFSRFIMVNCDKIKKGDVHACDDLRQKKESRKIVSYYSSSKFLNFAGKKIQNPPLSQHYSHPSDQFKVSEFQKLVEDVIPNFLQEMTSLEQYYQWLKVRYSPKLVFLTRQQEIPLVIKQLGVHYFLRFDLAFVSDLTESIVQQMNITSFPKLLVVKYNYQEYTYDIFHYKSTDFSVGSFQKIKDFLQPYALKEQRNDYLFHKIRLPTERGIITVKSKAQILQELDKAQGWVILSEVKGQPIKLKAVQEKYGRYFDYIHLQSEEETEILGLYDHEKEKSYEMPNDEVSFQPLNSSQFAKASTIWMAKDYVVICVREKYAHLCAIEHQVLFRGLTHCLILKESDYEQTSKSINIQFQVGFVSFENDANSQDKITGRSFKNASFQEVYNSIQSLTKRKAAQMIEAFKKKPIRSIENDVQLETICITSKKCVLLFTHPKKDRTAYQYLEDIAINFINQYEFYEVDLSCNQEFITQVPSLKANYGGLLVYHPKKSSYVSLKAKLSKSTFEKFLKANLQDNKKLPFHNFTNTQIQINSCQKTQQKGESDSL